MLRASNIKISDENGKAIKLKSRITYTGNQAGMGKQGEPRESPLTDSYHLRRRELMITAQYSF